MKITEIEMYYIKGLIYYYRILLNKNKQNNSDSRLTKTYCKHIK